MESFAGNRPSMDTMRGSGTGAPAVSLSELRAGECARVTRLLGGSFFRTRMLSMGIVPGRRIEVLSGRHHHPYLVRVGDARVMIGWGMLDRVVVSRVGADHEAL